MNQKTIILALFIPFIFIACFPTKKIENTNKNWIFAYAENLYENPVLQFNADSSYVLILSDNKTPELPNFKTRFTVLNAATKETVLQQEMNNTTVVWHSLTELSLTRQLGYVDKETGVSQNKTIVSVVQKQ